MNGYCQRYLNMRMGNRRRYEPRQRQCDVTVLRIETYWRSETVAVFSTDTEREHNRINR